MVFNYFVVFWRIFWIAKRRLPYRFKLRIEFVLLFLLCIYWIQYDFSIRIWLTVQCRVDQLTFDVSNESCMNGIFLRLRVEVVVRRKIVQFTSGLAPFVCAEVDFAIIVQVLLYLESCVVPHLPIVLVLKTL